MAANTTPAGITRRSLLKTGGALGALAAAGAGVLAQTPFTTTEAAHAESAEKIVSTHCGVNCGSCCYLQLHVRDGAITYVESDNTGEGGYDDQQVRACLRGRSIRRWLQSPDRLDYPMKRVGRRGEGKFERISWEEALDTIESELRRVYDQYGPEAVYMHHGTGCYTGLIRDHAIWRLLGLTGGFLNLYGDYSFSQIYEASQYTYGQYECLSGTVEHLQEGQLVVLFGYTPADTRMSGGGYSHYFQRQLEEKHCEVVHIDYRLNDSACNWGGEWLPIRPGTDGALCAALAFELIENGWADIEFLHTYCVGFDDETMPEGKRGQGLSYKDYILGTGYDGVPKTCEWASAITLIPADKIRDLARRIGEAETVFFAQGAGIQRHLNGEMASRAIMMLPALTGQIGRPGCSDARTPGYAGLFLPVMEYDNPVSTTISYYTFVEAINDATSMNSRNAGVRGEALDYGENGRGEREEAALKTGIKFLIGYANNSFTNQHGSINYVHDILADESKCEFILCYDVFMSDSCKYADILLPDLTLQEQMSLAQCGYADPDYHIIFGQAAYEPKGERRSVYDVCCELARRFGVYDEFTEGGKTQEDWLRGFYESFVAESGADFENLPTWEDGLKQGIWKGGVGTLIPWEDFVSDPTANPLGTPSGKIELYSEQLQGVIDTLELEPGEELAAIPLYTPGLWSHEDCTEEYPLQISAFHYKAHTHSSYATNPLLEQEAPCWLWMNPLDAEERGIEDGDTVRVFNANGEIRKQVKVTDRIVPGVVSMPTGSRHEADMYGDRIDYGGCVNTLSSVHATPLCKGTGAHSIIGQVEKVEEE